MLLGLMILAVTRLEAAWHDTAGTETRGRDATNY